VALSNRLSTVHHPRGSITTLVFWPANRYDSFGGFKWGNQTIPNTSRMLFGPIFSVEMTTSARRARYFLVRAIYAVIVFLVLFSVYVDVFRYDDLTDISTIARYAATFFLAFSVVQLGAVFLIGPAMVVGTIATERERRTIEYLFASQLSNAEIVLGKLAARLLHVAYLVLAGLPILALAMLLGGISPEVLLMVFVITLTSIVLVGCLSIWVSVWSPRSRDAVLRVYLILFMLLIAPFMAAGFAAMLGSSQWAGLIMQYVAVAHPFGLIFMVGLDYWSTTPSNAWEMVGRFVMIHATASALLVAAATWGVRRVHLKQAGRSSRWKSFRIQLWRPRLRNSPITWKELFIERSAGRLGIVGTIAQTILVVGVVVTSMSVVYEIVNRGSGWHGSNGRRYFNYAAMMNTFISCGGLLLLGARSACSVTSEKERDCWVSLLSTTLTPGEIVRGKILGNFYAVRGIVLLMCFVWLLGAIFEPMIMVMLPLLLAQQAALGLFIAALGLIFSLKCQTSLRAMGATLAVGLFVGGGYLLCCVPCMIGGGGSEIVLTACIPFLVAVPQVAMFEDISGNDFEMLLYAVMGTVGYAIAGLLLVGSCIGNFERFAGRVHSSWITPRQRSSRRTASNVPESLSEIVFDDIVDKPDDSGPAQ